jgi:molybdopterin synthase sulfur carrier subunit
VASQDIGKQTNYSLQIIERENTMIKVVFFAALREQLNCSELSLSSENLATVADLKKQLASTDDTWQQVFTNNTLLSAVNHDMVTGEQVIKSGDEVAFFPPVTGG